MTLLIIRGEENKGKTTLCAEIYSELLKHVNQEHLFGETSKEMKKVSQNAIVYEDGNPLDFKAVLTKGDKKIGILSRGDIVDDCFIKSLNELLLQKVNILICCTRSINRKNSTFRYIEEHYKNYPKKEFWVKFAENKAEKQKVKQQQAKEIVEYILNKL